MGGNQDWCTDFWMHLGGCAALAAKNALKKNLPVPFLLLRHRNKSFKDLNWHWFMITGYEVKNGCRFLKYHTYGEEQEVDFQQLWATGTNRKSGMTAIQAIRSWK